MPQPSGRSEAPRRRFGDPLASYVGHYRGLTRGELRRRDPSLYERLKQGGLLHEVPADPPPYGGEPLAYYRKHYPGISRGQLKQRDPKLYGLLYRLGLVGELPRAQRVHADPLATFRELYGELALRRTAFQRRDQGLYWRLKKDGLLDVAIPRPPAVRKPRKRPIRKASRVFDCR